MNDSPVAQPTIPDAAFDACREAMIATFAKHGYAPDSPVAVRAGLAAAYPLLAEHAVAVRYRRILGYVYTAPDGTRATFAPSDITVVMTADE